LTDFASKEVEEVATWIFGHTVEVLTEFDNSKAREVFGGE